MEGIQIATITKTPSGTWKALIRRKGWPTAIKTFRIRRDAENWARTVEDEIIRGMYVHRSHSERITVASALERYTREVTPSKKAGTRRREIGRAKLISLSLGDYSLAALNSEVVARFRDERLAKGLSNNTVRLDLALLSHMFTICIKEWGYGLTLNPVLNIRKPSPGEGRSRRLTYDEETRLLSACDSHSNPFLGWIVRIALYTAMRKGEILSLTKNELNLSKGIVTIHDTKNRDSRTIPLSLKARKTFNQVLAHPIRPIDTDLLFFGEPGRDRRRRSYTINRVWVKSLEKAGIQDFRFHDLRHEATSRLVEAGLSDQEVASITGHKSMQMLRRYTHLRSEDLIHKVRDI